MSMFYCTLCSTECHSFNTGMVGMVSFQMIPKRSDRVECQTIRIVRGQLRVPLRVMVFSWCSLGVLGDELTHKYPQYRACIRIAHRGTLVVAYPTIARRSVTSAGN